MIDRLEILVSRLRRLVSRNRWSAALLGLPRSIDADHGPGLVLIQVDGLGEKVLREAVETGRMPFLAHLMRDESYQLTPLYTGMPSSTPGFQAEFFYGVRTAVPAFGFFDRTAGHPLSMNEPFSASIIEKRILEKHSGLLQGGSSWSNVFSGEATEAHFCAATAGLDTLLRTLRPWRLIGLVVWNLLSLVRIAWTFLVETIVALWDFLHGELNRHSLRAELMFIPERVLVTVIMREVITAGACVDIERGLPVVQLNLLGYDEHAHHRGPRSRVALWTLKGIDRSIQRVWMAAHRAPQRDYQVWLYSDHGQEATRPWSDVGNAPLAEAVRHALQDVLPTQPLDGREHGSPAHPRSEAGRSRWFRMDLPDWLRRWNRQPHAPQNPKSAASKAGRPEDVMVLGEGPVGSVTLPQEVDFGTLQRLAQAIAESARVPLVLYEAPDESIHVHRSDGRGLRLPDDAGVIFGAEHPHLHEVVEDCIHLVKHENAGDLVLMGFDPHGPVSLQFERGAHGGPGPEETTAFALLPPELHALPGRLRPDVLRSLAQEVLKSRLRSTSSFSTVSRHTTTRDNSVRIMTYNVHGCRGMDGRTSPHRIARVIARQEPDIICLQELDVQRGRSGNLDQAMMIAGMLQAEYHFHGVNTLEDGQFGNAVLTVYPSRRIDAGSLPQWRPRMNLEPRGVLWVEVDVQGVPVQILNTHLSIVRWERRLQVEALLGEKWLQRSTPAGPRILCGDFNTAARSNDLQLIDAVLRNAVSDASAARVSKLRTWSSRLPMRRIDHVFVNPEVLVHAVHVPRSRLTQAASDHLPLVVDLTLQNGTVQTR